MTRQEFSAPVAGGALGGWVSGDGPNVVVLHGGPGMSAGYLDSIPEELAGYRVAWFQQRGLPPSTPDGPFDIATGLDDVTAVLDHLGWETAYVVGHSWGGHLALHVARTLAGRATAALYDLRISVPAYSAMWDSIRAEFAGLEAALPSIEVPVGFVAGAQSPIPTSVSHETAARIPGAFVDEVDGAGHMLWMEKPGCVKPALDTLVNGG